MSDYHERFHALAKNHLDERTFEALHRKARASAGGAAPRGQIEQSHLDDGDTSGPDAMENRNEPQDDDEPQQVNKNSPLGAIAQMWASTVKMLTGADYITKDAPAASPATSASGTGQSQFGTTHIDEPLGDDEDEDERKRKAGRHKRGKTVPPNEKQLITKSSLQTLANRIEESDGIEESDFVAIHLACGAERQPGALGFDLVACDEATIPHDLGLGIPLPDASVDRVFISKSAVGAEYIPFYELMAEVKRVSAPGAELFADFELEHITKGSTAAWDESAHPRNNAGQFGGAEAAMHAASHARAETTKNLSEHAAKRMAALKKKLGKGSDSEKIDSAIEQIKHIKKHSPGRAQVPLAQRLARCTDERRELVLKSLDATAPIAGVNAHKQIIYGPVLVPGEIHDSGHYMTPEDIEYTAHGYMQNARIIGAEHGEGILADVVESFIAPCDMEFDGSGSPYGGQVIPKGSWVAGVRVHDNAHWAKVMSGEYTGFSTGGFGKLEDWE